MNEKQAREAIILSALFKTTVEQSTHLINVFNQKPKHDFNVWFNQGWKVMEHMEKMIPNFKESVEKITDAIHEGLSEAKEYADNNLEVKE